MTFNESIALEVVKGLLGIVALAVGGGLVGRAIEKFKNEQALQSDLRKRQYDALGRMMADLAKVETAFFTMYLRMQQFPVLQKEEQHFEDALAEARASIDAATYLLGDITDQAVVMSNFFTDTMTKWTDQYREGKGVPIIRDGDEFFQELKRLREPLVALLPPLAPLKS